MNDERKFLHDIASPLSTAMFIIDSALDDLKSRATPDDEAIQQVLQIQQCLEKMKIMLQERRTIILK